jgi:hypothetical protein
MVDTCLPRESHEPRAATRMRHILSIASSNHFETLEPKHPSKSKSKNMNSSLLSSDANSVFPL